MTKTHPVHRTNEAAVGEELRAMFDELAERPVPPILIDLVEALEEKRRSHESGDDA